MAKKYVLQFNRPLLNIQGKPYEPKCTVGEALGDQIASAAAEKNIVKLWNWASAMCQGQEIDLDSEDFNTLRSFVELLPRASVLLKAQALDVFDSAQADVNQADAKKSQAK